jgi:DNA-directed RNA polymerase subunit RPC12/RpoP
MKRILTLITLLSTLFLASCKVNWLGEQYDTEWWVIFIPVSAILIGVWGIGGLLIAKKSYICPECKNTFHPRWWKTAFSIHIGSDRVLTCPNCGRRGFCKVNNYE